MSCGVGRRHGLDPAWLWRRPAVTAPIGPIAWEPPYAAGGALEKTKKKSDLSFVDNYRGFDLFDLKNVDILSL